MHPILGHGGRLPVYLAVWLPGSLVLAAVIALMGEDVGWAVALALALPLSQVYAFLCLAAWYPSRSTPLGGATLWRALVTHALAALLSSGFWLLLGLAWARLVSEVPALAGAAAGYRRQVPLFFAAGLVLYLLAVAASYLYLAFEASRAAEKRALEAQKNQELAARELELARAIQRRLLPAAEASGDGFRLAARNLAARFVAGDFYDYFTLADGTLRIAVADVAGKGIAASLIMATVKAVLPLIAADRSLAATLRELNRKLTAELAEREFVALALATFDPASGRLELVNAGLPDPYRLRHGAAPAAIEAPPPRLPLGLWPDVEHQSVAVELAPGDGALFLTDGFPEAQAAPGEPLGYAAFEALLDHRAGEPGAWLDRLIERVRAATAAEQDDDWTALLVERPGR